MAVPPDAGPVLDAIDAGLAALAAGRPVLVVDDADRENEGDVVLAAQHATPAWVGWTVRHTSGVLCVPMPGRWADHLRLPVMVPRNEDPRHTAYTVSTDARHGIGTGISATDRATGLRLLADPATGPADLVRPGHLFPLRAREGGVLERAGHTEAAVDLCEAAGLSPVAVIAEVVGDDGEPLRLPALRALADAEGLPLVAIADLVAWRRARGGGDLADDSAPAGPRVSRVATSRLPTRHGVLWATAYLDKFSGEEHLALTTHEPGAPGPRTDRAPLVRVHSECVTGDSIGSLRCDCGPQLDAAIEAVLAEPGGGAVVYLRGHEGRGIGLAAKISAYALQDAGLDTVEANTAQGLPVDAREYAAAGDVLVDLGHDRVRLLTNNPAKVTALRTAGVAVVERVPIVVGVQRHNTRYLRTKRDRMGHLLPSLPARDGVARQDGAAGDGRADGLDPEDLDPGTLAPAAAGRRG